MEINELQAFIEVSRTASFSQAAEKLYLTQPAVSKRVANLESELDLRLFDRIGRKISLTEAGRALLPRATELLNNIADMKRLATNLSGQISGPLVMGTSHHIGLHRLPPILRRFTASNPAVKLDIRFLDSEAACRAVETGELEIAVVTLPTTPSGKLKLVRVWADPLVFVVAADHELAGTRGLSLEQLTRYPAVLPGPTTYTRAILEDKLAEYSLHPTVNMSTNYLETLKMLVSTGQGWSLLPATMLDQEVIALDLPVLLERQLGIVTHSGRTLSNAASALSGMLQQETAESRNRPGED